jgi:hypothetical protein
VRYLAVTARATATGTHRVFVWYSFVVSLGCRWGSFL